VRVVLLLQVSEGAEGRMGVRTMIVALMRSSGKRYASAKCTLSDLLLLVMCHKRGIVVRVLL
jgi:hypothetical protein